MDRARDRCRFAMPCTRSPISSERSGAAGPAHRQLYSARSREPRGAALSTHAKRSRSRTSFVPAIESTWGECPPASAPRMPAEIGLPVTTGTELQRGAPLVPDSHEQGGTPQPDRLRSGAHNLSPAHPSLAIHRRNSYAQSGSRASSTIGGGAPQWRSHLLSS